MRRVERAKNAEEKNFFLAYAAIFLATLGILGMASKAVSGKWSRHGFRPGAFSPTIPYGRIARVACVRVNEMMVDMGAKENVGARTDQGMRAAKGTEKLTLLNPLLNGGFFSLMGDRLSKKTAVHVVVIGSENVSAGVAAGRAVGEKLGGNVINALRDEREIEYARTVMGLFDATSVLGSIWTHGRNGRWSTDEQLSQAQAEQESMTRVPEKFLPPAGRVPVRTDIADLTLRRYLEDRAGFDADVRSIFLP